MERLIRREACGRRVTSSQFSALGRFAASRRAQCAAPRLALVGTHQRLDDQGGTSSRQLAQQRWGRAWWQGCRQGARTRPRPKLNCVALDGRERRHLSGNQDHMRRTGDGSKQAQVQMSRQASSSQAARQPGRLRRMRRVSRVPTLRALWCARCTRARHGVPRCIATYRQFLQRTLQAVRRVAIRITYKLAR